MLPQFLNGSRPGWERNNHLCMGISEFILFQGHAIETIGMIVRALGEERVKFVDSAPSPIKF